MSFEGQTSFLDVLDSLLAIVRSSRLVLAQESDFEDVHAARTLYLPLYLGSGISSWKTSD
jgi:hypothetical protein